MQDSHCIICDADLAKGGHMSNCLNQYRCSFCKAPFDTDEELIDHEDNDCPVKFGCDPIDDPTFDPDLRNDLRKEMCR